MPDLTAKRTLVKSPPELWEELSEVEGLAKHFGAFGEIKITKLEPEHTVAWEGEHGSGTVSIEPSGWGTKVTLHAELPEAPEASTAEPEEPEAGTAEPEQPEATTAEPEEPKATAERRPAPDSSAPEPQPEEAQPEPVVTESEHNVDESGSDVAQPVLVEEPVIVEAVSLPAPEPRRRGFWAWLFRSRTDAAGTEPVLSAPTPQSLVTEPEPGVTKPEPEPSAAEPECEIATETHVEAAASEPAAPQPELERGEPEGVEADQEPEDAGPDGAEPEDAGPQGAEPGDAEPGDAEPQEADAEGRSLPIDPERARFILDEALEALGSAHHRPFSRG
jgi:hypothetical protein